MEAEFVILKEWHSNHVSAQYSDNTKTILSPKLSCSYWGNYLSSVMSEFHTQMRGFIFPTIVSSTWTERAGENSRSRVQLHLLSTLLWPLKLTLRSYTLQGEIMRNLLSGSQLLEWLLAWKQVLTPFCMVAWAAYPDIACYVHSMTVAQQNQRGQVKNNETMHNASII